MNLENRRIAREVLQITYVEADNALLGGTTALAEGFHSIVNQKTSYGCERENQDLI
jgi:hypothetical protein